MWAPYLAYMAVMEHVGRKSGTSYRTPVYYGDQSIGCATSRLRNQPG
ncbi:hypothetical protein [Mycolicibacterium brisbanense]